jgi:hypothetical protein
MTASNFPVGLDTDANLGRVLAADALVPAHHNNLVDALEAVEGAMGVRPAVWPTIAGSAASVYGLLAQRFGYGWPYLAALQMNSTALSIPAGATVDAVWASTKYDPSLMRWTSDTVMGFTTPKTGLYRMDIWWQFTAGAVGDSIDAVIVRDVGGVTISGDVVGVVGKQITGFLSWPNMLTGARNYKLQLTNNGAAAIVVSAGFAVQLMGSVA